VGHDRAVGRAVSGYSQDASSPHLAPTQSSQVDTAGSLDRTVTPSAKAIATERARRFIKRHGSLMGAFESCSRAIDSIPGPVGKLLRSARGRVVRETGWAELVLVIDSLEAEGMPYWLAGGWGVDALVGRRTRPHKDIDVVIEDFEQNEPRVRKVFEALGFEHVTMDRGGVWMPSRSNFEDSAGHRIELLAIDWDHLRRAFDLDPERSSQPDAQPGDLAREVFCTGTIHGRKLPCLTVPAQLLFHTGFPLESAGKNDVSLLRTELGPVS
jgi:lincosamide nucleotidyltransferase A/C/D/E